MRILHFSDIHLNPVLQAVPLRDWLGKRAFAGLNYFLRRRPHFLGAEEKVDALARFAAENADLVIFTGDYVLMGTEPELAAARAAIEPFLASPLEYINIPGNHDIYLPDTVRQERFGRHFGDTLISDWPEPAVDGVWPLVRFLGDEIAVVAVNSAQPNPLIWRSNGRIPDAQLDALRDLLAEPRIRDRFVFVLTHYAPRLSDGRPDTRLHGLQNADEFLAICSDLPRAAILFGHVHHCYRVDIPGVKPPLFNAGSATINGREGLWYFEMEGSSGRATRGAWNGVNYYLTDESHEV